MHTSAYNTQQHTAAAVLYNIYRRVMLLNWLNTSRNVYNRGMRTQQVPIYLHIVIMCLTLTLDFYMSTLYFVIGANLYQTHFKMYITVYIYMRRFCLPLQTLGQRRIHYELKYLGYMILYIQVEEVVTTRGSRVLFVTFEH